MTKKCLPKKFRQKFVLGVEIVNLRYGQFSQNRHFKFSPVDFRYYRMSGKKFKNFGRSFFSWLLDAQIRFELSCFVKKWHGDKGWGDLKKKLPKVVFF